MLLKKRNGSSRRKERIRMERISRWIVMKLRLYQPGKRNKILCQELIALSGGNPKAVKRYYVEKISLLLWSILIAVIVAIVLVVVNGLESNQLQMQQLSRPGYGMGEREEELTAQVIGEEERESLRITIQDQKYTQEELEQLLEKGKKEIEEVYLGENSTADEVRRDLILPKTVQNEQVTVGWTTIPYGYVDTDGTLLDVSSEEGTVVELCAVLNCQGKELRYETAVCIYPPNMTERERFWKNVRDEVRMADERDAERENLQLPQEVDGKSLIWSRNKEQGILIILLLILVLPCALYIRKDEIVHEKARNRKQQLVLDYPDMVWKMTMLLGAGLTIRGAFARIAQDYEAQQDYEVQQKNSGQQKIRRKRKEIHYVYEEMCYACREMQSGVSEAKAYENFGRRCDLQSYIKFGSLLSSNLRKGSKGLAATLEKEAARAMEERKNLARKLGERAGTKLLFPMIMMFGIVLIVLIVPAFLSL